MTSMNHTSSISVKLCLSYEPQCMVEGAVGVNRNGFDDELESIEDEEEREELERLSAELEALRASGGGAAAAAGVGADGEEA